MNRVKVFSRDILKLVAIISMFIDHMGKIFFPDVVLLTIIGRLAFPIFAFFVAEGVYYTKSIKKYISNILIFAFISQIPYYFYKNSFLSLDILFTLLVSILIILLINKIIKSKLIGEKLFLSLIAIFSLFICYWLGISAILDYGLYGVLLPVVFYFLREKCIAKYSVFVCLTMLYVLDVVLRTGDLTFARFIQLFSILSTVLLVFYDDGRKGNKKFKYLFYWFYPIHLAVLVLIKFIIL